MTREIDLDIHGQELRSSCLADCVEMQAAKGMSAFTEADLADRINDSGWLRLLEPRLVGDGHEFERIGNKQDQSRDAARRVFEMLAQRKTLLSDKYPFNIEHGRLVLKPNEGEVYLWFLFVSLVHGFALTGIPDPTVEFEKVVSLGLSNIGLPSMTVGTSTLGNNFEARVASITQEFPHLVGTLDEAVRSRSANDGGIDTFASLRCANDTRHGHWAFVGQSTVGKSDSWKLKIQEVFPNFWHKVFGERVTAIPFFATPHHIQDDYLHSLFQNHERCLLDRIRLTLWTPNVPNSFRSYKDALDEVDLQ